MTPARRPSPPHQSPVRVALLWAALVTTVALVAAACGGSSSSPTAADATDGATDTESNTAAAAESDTEASQDDPSPQEEAGDQQGDEPGDGQDDEPEDEDSTQAAIDEALLLISGADTADQEAVWAEQQRQVEETVAQCMRNEGFEYTPVDYSQFDSFEEDDWNPADRDWVAENGLGISTGIGGETFAEPVGQDDFKDPNADYVSTLSEGEQTAYYRVLYGDDVESEANSEVDFDDPAAVEAYEEAYENRANKGCYDTAWDQTNEASAVDAVFSALDDSFEDIEARVLIDPRLSDGLTSWTACMAESGYDFASPDEMWDAAQERSEEIWGSFSSPFEAYTEEDLEGLSDEQFEELYPEPELDQELIDEIQEWEIAVALADFDCGGPELTEIAQEIWTEEVAQVIESKRDEIADAIAAGN